MAGLAKGLPDVARGGQLASFPGERFPRHSVLGEGALGKECVYVVLGGGVRQTAQTIGPHSFPPLLGVDVGGVSGSANKTNGAPGRASLAPHSSPSTAGRQGGFRESDKGNAHQSDIRAPPPPHSGRVHIFLQLSQKWERKDQTQVPRELRGWGCSEWPVEDTDGLRTQQGCPA